MANASGFFGNAAKASAAEVGAEYASLLGPSERVEHAYKLVRDVFIFTNLRLILVDKQGISGKKVEYLSIPYKNVNRFAVETAGTFDLDAELKLWTSGMAAPIEKQFSKDVNIYEVQALLSQYVCCGGVIDAGEIAAPPLVPEPAPAPESEPEPEPAPVVLPPEPVVPAPAAEPEPAAAPAAPEPAPAPAAASSAPESWLSDPTGRHELRYWDGSKWTANVSDKGVVGSDPLG